MGWICWHVHSWEDWQLPWIFSRTSGWPCDPFQIDGQQQLFSKIIDDASPACASIHLNDQSCKLPKRLLSEELSPTDNPIINSIWLSAPGCYLHSEFLWKLYRCTFHKKFWHFHFVFFFSNHKVQYPTCSSLVVLNSFRPSQGSDPPPLILILKILELMIYTTVAVFSRCNSIFLHRVASLNEKTNVN